MWNTMHRLMNARFWSGARDEGSSWSGSWMPVVDIYEGNEAFTLKAELPGFSKDDVQVEIKDNVLTLQGERKRDTAAGEAQYHRVERAYGVFRRSFRLPALVEAGKAVATLKDGVLELRLPKAEGAKPQLIRTTA
jgi:HSP20 family protein